MAVTYEEFRADLTTLVANYEKRIAELEAKLEFLRHSMNEAIGIDRPCEDSERVELLFETTDAFRRIARAASRSLSIPSREEDYDLCAIELCDSLQVFEDTSYTMLTVHSDWKEEV